MRLLIITQAQTKCTMAAFYHYAIRAGICNGHKNAISIP